MRNGRWQATPHSYENEIPPPPHPRRIPRRRARILRRRPRHQKEARLGERRFHQGPGTATKGEVTGGLPADARTLQLGDAAPDFKLLGIDGKTHTLADYKAAKLLMVVFLSNHCPYSHASETRLIPLAKEFKAQGLDVVSINPNSPDSVRVDELGYSKYNDGYAEMKLYARDSGFPFPYLYDGDTQAAAKAYGCLATPHVFLFDRERKLRYVGRVDDSRFEDPKTVTSHDTRNAVVELLAGKPVTTPKTIVMGCSTKWNTKRDDIAKAEEKWKSEAVDLELIDATGVAKLAKNDSNRLRLVNVWATWCAPCVAEFPELVSLARRVGNRDFELVTISMDDPKLQPQVKAFLEKSTWRRPRGSSACSPPKAAARSTSSTPARAPMRS